MTEAMTNGLHPLDDVAAYALGALEEAEARDLAAHLRACPECAAELERLSVGVAALPLSAPQFAAPATLRRRVLAEVGAAAPARSRGRARLPRVALAPRVLAPLAAGLAAVVVIVALVLSGGTASTRVVSAQVSVPTAAARLRVTGGRGELIVERMPQPPAGKIYEVWLARPGRAVAPTDALFDVARAGTTVVPVPGSLSGVSEVMVTAEPLGGSAHPTSAAVIVARL